MRGGNIKIGNFSRTYAIETGARLILDIRIYSVWVENGMRQWDEKPMDGKWARVVHWIWFDLDMSPYHAIANEYSHVKTINRKQKLRARKKYPLNITNRNGGYIIVLCWTFKKMLARRTVAIWNVAQFNHTNWEMRISASVTRIQSCNE